MIDENVIIVKNIEKSYKLYEKNIDRLKEVLNPFRKKYHKKFNALKNISFEVKKGQTVGIIGNNGAGKSTILKIVTGVLYPDSGNIKVLGSVSSLLELGAGFNMELTGLENIYLNATLHGKTKKEIESKIQSILDFANIGDYINQPVKTYSSGMFARLSFSVAISDEPDILIVDEALSVGDIAFQYKCFEKMKELKKNGVTILLVTHSMSQILENCDSALLIHNGEVLENSYDVDFVVTEYQKIIRGVKKQNSLNNERNDNLDFKIDINESLYEKRFGSHRAIIRKIELLNKNEISELFKSGETITVKFYILSKAYISNVILGLSLRTPQSSDIWGDNNLFANREIILNEGLNIITYSFSSNFNSGEYLLFGGLATTEKGEREELDQRWPISKISIYSSRDAVGFVYAPITIH